MKQFIGNIKGPQGPRGPMGAQGPIGKTPRVDFVLKSNGDLYYNDETDVAEGNIQYEVTTTEALLEQFITKDELQKALQELKNAHNFRIEVEQSDNQVIHVIIHPKEAKECIDVLDYSIYPTFEAKVEANFGYNPGKLNIESGILDKDIVIKAVSNATKKEFNWSEVEQIDSSLKTVESLKVNKALNKINDLCKDFELVNFECLENVIALDNAFAGCAKLNFVNMPNVTSFGKNAFANCHNLEEVNLLQLAKLGEGSFKDCMNLRYLSLDVLKKITGEVFDNCNFEALNMPMLSMDELNIPVTCNIKHLILNKVADTKASFDVMYISHEEYEKLDSKELLIKFNGKYRKGKNVKSIKALPEHLKRKFNHSDI